MNYLEIPLDVADVNIKSIEFTEEGEIFITITSTIQGTVCQSCGQKIFDFYGENREITHSMSPFVATILKSCTLNGTFLSFMVIPS